VSSIEPCEDCGVLLTISDLELWTHIGVPDEERRSEQRILATLELTIKEEAEKSDSLEDTLDYDALVRVVKKCAKGERKTLERLGGEIIEALKKFDRIEKMTVHLTKFVIPGTAGITVSLSHP